MHCFALAQDLTLATPHYQRHFLGADDPQALPLDRLYLGLGAEVGLIARQLQPVSATPVPPGTAPPLPPGLHLVNEDALLAWPHFPARLGRISTRCAGDGLHQHTEAAPLPAQLQALRARKPGKQHWRIAIVNGFGTNLGDSSVGITAFRVVLQHLRACLPSFSCDALLSVTLGDRPRFS